MSSSILPASTSHPLRGGPSFSLRNRARRALWTIAWLALISWTPPPFRLWRTLVYRLFGGRIAWSANIRSSARVWAPWQLQVGEHSSLGPGVTCYNMAPITLGDDVVVSQGAHLCAGSHDMADPDFQLVAAPISLGSSCWIAAEAFVGPGVTIGEGAVLGARGVAFKALAPWTVYAGNPARAIKPRVLRAQVPAGRPE
jgi:putative colanic acid biosynthesis acetyltransferase WcaF